MKLIYTLFGAESIKNYRYHAQAHFILIYHHFFIQTREHNTN